MLSAPRERFSPRHLTDRRAVSFLLPEDLQVEVSDFFYNDSLLEEKMRGFALLYRSASAELNDLIKDSAKDGALQDLAERKNVMARFDELSAQTMMLKKELEKTKRIYTNLKFLGLFIKSAQERIGRLNKTSQSYSKQYARGIWDIYFLLHEAGLNLES